MKLSSKHLKKLLVIVVIALLVWAIIWNIVVYFSHWDEVLSPAQWFHLTWKPVIALAFLGVALKFLLDEI